MARDHARIVVDCARYTRRGQRLIACFSLKTVYLNGLDIKTQALLLVCQKILDVLALIALELDHLSHLGVGNDGAIAGELLLNHFKDLLLVELLGQALDRGQGLATIALCKISAL
jgi:hypothetical protein